MIGAPEHEAWCGRVSGQLSGFIDGELDADDASLVTFHLGVCSACARFAAELAATVAALRGLSRRGARGDAAAPSASAL